MTQLYNSDESNEQATIPHDLLKYFTNNSHKYHQFILQEQEGRLYPYCIPVQAMERVLHLGCGTGEWLFDLARRHTRLRCYGIETDANALHHAIVRRNLSGMHQIELRKVDHWQALPIPDNYLDLIFTRFRTTSLSPHLWPQVIREWMRALRPGGWLVIVDADYYETSSPAFMALHDATMQAMKQLHHSLDTTGTSLGVAQRLYGMFIQAGLHEVAYDLDSIDIGFMSGTAGRHFFATIMQYSKMARQLVLQQNILSAEKFDKLMAQANQECQAADFCGWSMLISTYGRKPYKQP